MKKQTVLFALVLLTLSFAFSAEAKLNLVEQAEKDGMTLYWDPLAGSGIIEKNGHQISFRAGDSIVLQDYSLLQETDAPELSGGKLLVSQQFIDSAEMFFKTEADENPFKIGAILIDPGHGGKDPGAVQNWMFKGKKVTVREKDVNLKVGKLLYTRLKAE